MIHQYQIRPSTLRISVRHVRLDQKNWTPAFGERKGEKKNQTLTSCLFLSYKSQWFHALIFIPQADL